ncbi:MAG: flagellar export chaperone FliS [Desulfobia sp.]
MNTAIARNAYRRSEENVNIHPFKLVHMMFERSIAHLHQAEEAMQKKDPAKRGENLSKAIAIITELYSAVPADQDNEAAVFLKSLYNSILTELPKVSAFGDREVLSQALRYLEKLKEIWENTAMLELESGWQANAGHQESRAKENLQQDELTKPTALSLSI